LRPPDQAHPKTVSNVVTVLGTIRRIALEWGRLTRLSCRVRLVKVQKPKVEFYEPADYERLLEGAAKADRRT
jgi:hypothetical protein